MSRYPGEEHCREGGWGESEDPKVGESGPVHKTTRRRHGLIWEPWWDILLEHCIIELTLGCFDMGVGWGRAEQEE